MARQVAAIALGLALLAWLWLLMALVGFVVFDRDTPALLIVSVTLALWGASVALLAWKSPLRMWPGLAWMLAWVAVLVGLYMLPLRDDLPQQARETVAEAGQAHPDDRYAMAEAVFDLLPGHFTGPTREYLLQPQRIFLQRSAAYYWDTRGYVPSHLLAQMYRHMLLASDRFQPHEVRYRTGRCFNSPHGYVEIDHPDQTVYADPWAAMHFPDYRFGQVVDMPSCDSITAEAGPSGEPLDQ